MKRMMANGMRRLLAGGLLCLSFACGGEQAPEAAGTIPRDIFVGTYVELRMAALHAPDGRVTPAAKAEILEAKGVTEADLLEYVDVHGARVQFMVEVWAEIDDTLRSLRTEDDPAPTS
jgi:hypothetical protein